MWPDAIHVFFKRDSWLHCTVLEICCVDFQNSAYFCIFLNAILPKQSERHHTTIFDLKPHMKFQVNTTAILLHYFYMNSDMPAFET